MSQRFPQSRPMAAAELHVAETGAGPSCFEDAARPTRQKTSHLCCLRPPPRKPRAASPISERRVAAARGVGPAAPPLRQGRVPAEGFGRERRFRALEFVDAVRHPRFEEGGLLITKADIDAGERRDTRRRPSSVARSRGCRPSRPSAPSKEVSLNDRRSASRMKCCIGTLAQSVRSWSSTWGWVQVALTRARVAASHAETARQSAAGRCARPSRGPSSRPRRRAQAAAIS